jgi:hypothetical protein|tara:strand:+ start:1940 stop:2758 length:819 start_codon:yes stop_codon:yes gene_type:complete
MSVNRIKIVLNATGDTAGVMNIPISLQSQPIGQAEIIEREFISKEIEKSINPIVDYEKIRFLPVVDFTTMTQINTIEYNVNILNPAGTGYLNTWGDVGFTQDDIKFRRSKFLKSFITLRFYDSDDPMSQNLVMVMTIFPFIRDDFYTTATSGILKPVNSLPVRFILSDPIKNPKGFAEGYYTYYYKHLIEQGLAPTDLFMRASFMNAENGNSTNMMFANTQQQINTLIPKIFCRYSFTRLGDGYYYSINDIAGIVSTTGTQKTINMYEINVS